MCKAEEDSSSLNVLQCDEDANHSSKYHSSRRHTDHHHSFKYEHLIKTSTDPNGSGSNSILQGIADSRKRNKYRMLGTDLKRKAVHLVSYLGNLYKILCI